MPKITKHILWKWLYIYVIVSMAFSFTFFASFVLSAFLKHENTPISDFSVLAFKIGFLLTGLLASLFLAMKIGGLILGVIEEKLHKHFPSTKSAPLEFRYLVNMSDTTISVTGPDGKKALINFEHITSIIVETNDTGPWGMDVWFIIKGQNGELCTYPMGAKNDLLALDYYATLPGFELKGINSTENALFVCWEKA